MKSLNYNQRYSRTEDRVTDNQSILSAAFIRDNEPAKLFLNY